MSGQNGEPRTENQEPHQRRAHGCPEADLRELSEQWGRGLLSTDEALGCLLAHLARQSADKAPCAPQLNTQHVRTPSEALGTLLRQLGDAVDALAGPQLDLWRAGGLWYWRWEDTRALCAHGLGSLGEALTDAVEQRHPAAFPSPPEPAL